MRLGMLAVMAVIWGGAAAVQSAHAQGDPTASRGLEISVFGGPAGVFTGLAGGHNISFVGGLDLGFRPFHGWVPAVEGRGMYPIADGSVDTEKNGMGGLRLERRRGGSRFYGDFLFGRGEFNYLNGGYPNLAGDFRYLTSTTNVYGPGAGVSHDLPHNLGVFADAQYQHYSTPVTVSGSLWSTAVTIGVVYRLPFLRHGHPYP